VGRGGGWGVVVQRSKTKELSEKIEESLRIRESLCIGELRAQIKRQEWTVELMTIPCTKATKRSNI
jgi:hypothetical protein